MYVIVLHTYGRKVLFQLCLDSFISLTSRGPNHPFSKVSLPDLLPFSLGSSSFILRTIPSVLRALPGPTPHPSLVLAPRLLLVVGVPPPRLVPDLERTLRT